MSEAIISKSIEILLPVLVAALTAVFSWLGVQIKNLYQDKVNTDTKRKIVEDTVKYVQQVYKDADGAVKLEHAKTTAYTWLSEKGIPIEGTELNVLIESAVLGLKQGLSTETTTTTTTLTSGYSQVVDNKQPDLTYTVTTATTQDNDDCNKE